MEFEYAAISAFQMILRVVEFRAVCFIHHWLKLYQLKALACHLFIHLTEK